MEAGFLPKERIAEEYNECSELLAIFTSIGSKNK